MRPTRPEPRRRQAEQRPAPRGSIDRVSARYATALAIATLLLVDTAFGRLPITALIGYLVVSLLAAALYVIDKRRAQSGEWRISEATLHGVDLLGGIVGGLVAQEVIRHKTAKRPFAITTFAISGLHLVLLLGVAAGVVSLDVLLSLVARVLQ